MAKWGSPVPTAGWKGLDQRGEEARRTHVVPRGLYQQDELTFHLTGTQMVTRRSRWGPGHIQS